MSRGVERGPMAAPVLVNGRHAKSAWGRTNSTPTPARGPGTYPLTTFDPYCYKSDVGSLLRESRGKYRGKRAGRERKVSVEDAQSHTRVPGGLGADRDPMPTTREGGFFRAGPSWLNTPPLPYSACVPPLAPRPEITPHSAWRPHPGIVQSREWAREPRIQAAARTWAQKRRDARKTPASTRTARTLPRPRTRVRGDVTRCGAAGGISADIAPGGLPAQHQVVW